MGFGISGTSTLETYYSNFIAIAIIYANVPEVQEESILADRNFIHEYISQCIPENLPYYTRN